MISHHILNIRDKLSRVLFNTVVNTWSTCMDMCLMYSQARAPSFTTQAELEDLLRWAKATTIDPVTMELHPTLPSWFYWIAYHRTFR